MYICPFTSLDWDSSHILGFWRLKTKTEHLTHSTSSKHDWHTLRKLLKLSSIDFSGNASAKEPASQCTRHSRDGWDSWVGKIAWKREWQPTSVFLSGEFHGQRSLAGHSPWDCKESDLTNIYSGLLEFSIGMEPTVVTGLIMHPLLAVLFCFFFLFLSPFPIILPMFSGINLR